MYKDKSWTYCPVCGTNLSTQAIAGKIRPHCTRCGFTQFYEPKVVAVVVIRHKDCFVLGKRNSPPGKGLWSFFGGYLDRGETVEAGAIREVKEETNLDVTLDRLVGVYSQPDDPHILIVYTASIIGNALAAMVPQSEEISDLALFSWDAMPPLAFAVDWQILRDMGYTLDNITDKGG